MVIAPLLRKLVIALVWAGCAASAVAWGLALSGKTLAVPANAQLLAPQHSQRGDPMRLFSLPPVAEQAAAPAQASRFKLVGVVAPVQAPVQTGTAASVARARPARGEALGVALLSTDGKPARAYRVGAPVDGGWVLQAVSQRSASLGPAGGVAALQLELPALPPAATGMLAPALPDGAAPPAPPGSVPGAAPVAAPLAPAPAGLSGAAALGGGGSPLVPPASAAPAAEAPPDALRAEAAPPERQPGMKPLLKR
jgi:general secretion pathway protein C